VAADIISKLLLYWHCTYSNIRLTYCYW